MLVSRSYRSLSLCAYFLYPFSQSKTHRHIKQWYWKMFILYSLSSRRCIQEEEEKLVLPSVRQRVWVSFLFPLPSSSTVVRFPFRFLRCTIQQAQWKVVAKLWIVILFFFYDRKRETLFVLWTLLFLKKIESSGLSAAIPAKPLKSHALKPSYKWRSHGRKCDTRTKDRRHQRWIALYKTYHRSSRYYHGI